MKDAFGRTINYLRVSVTDRCNLRCRYCMPEDLPLSPREDILRSEEILRVCRIAAELGIGHIRVTGGEPLVRLGVAELMAELRRLPGVEWLTMTTNGTLLARNMAQLAAAGLDGVNISLDTLKPDTFRAITGSDALKDVLEGIDAALAAGLRVKINCVPLYGVNDGELADIAALAENRPLDVRFIEAMPIGAGRAFPPVDSASIRDGLLRIYPKLRPKGSGSHAGPARYYAGEPLLGSLGFISAMTDCFCETCNRVRLTSDGMLKLCLYYEQGTDLRALLRGGADDGALRAAFAQAVSEKPERHAFGEGLAPAEPKKMWQIGG